MIRNILTKQKVVGFMAAGLLSTAGAVNAAAPLPDWNGELPTAIEGYTSLQYQDFTVYSLNYLTQLSEKNPLNPILGGQKYDYDTSPGKIKYPEVVLVTGAEAPRSNLDTCGGTAAASGCDQAYHYPSPSDTYMTTTSTYPDPTVIVPGENYGAPTPDSRWTITQQAAKDAIGDGDLTFLFNLNEDNCCAAGTIEGQSLLVSARVMLTDSAGNELISFYLGANSGIQQGLGLPTAETLWGLAGEPEADPANTVNPALGSEVGEVYNPGLVDFGGANGGFALDPRWAFVHGAISVDATTGAFLGFGSCTESGLAPGNCETVNQNLGADQAAFAIINMQLSDLIKAGSYMGTDIAFMEVDIIISGQSNGYEQVLMISTSNEDFFVDEPGTLAIIALGLLAMGMRKRRVQTKSAV